MDWGGREVGGGSEQLRGGLCMQLAKSALVNSIDRTVYRKWCAALHHMLYQAANEGGEGRGGKNNV